MPGKFNDDVVAEFRANQGRVGGVLAGTPIILIHHIGAASGTERVTPLAYTTRSDGRLIIAASNGGSQTHPAWYHNLKAHPAIEVELGAELFSAMAEEVEGAARTELWPKLIAASPTLGEYQAKTARRIPLFTLARCAKRGGAAHPGGPTEGAATAYSVHHAHDRAVDDEPRGAEGRAPGAREQTGVGEVLHVAEVGLA
jgi:deazaflavin-dependent oxidoreductase (nitroreductase family)